MGKKYTRKIFLGGKKNRKNRRGGDSVPNYGSAAGWMSNLVGDGNTQYKNVFGPNPINTSQSNTIVSQSAGSRRRKRGKKGGFWGTIAQAIVPLGLLGLQQTYKRRYSSSSSSNYKGKNFTYKNRR